MQTVLSHFDFPGSSVRILRVDFDANTLQPNDLLWLPHHHRLQNAVTKRRAEHLAGRIAACEALSLYGVKDFVPGIGLHREPCWPPGFTGSITHTEKIALAAVIADRNSEHCAMGIDCEMMMSEQNARELADGIINMAERRLLQSCALPFPAGLTLVFSAKESLFKALYRHVGRYFDFSAAEVTQIKGDRLELTLVSPLGPFAHGMTFTALWNSDGARLMTLIQHG